MRRTRLLFESTWLGGLGRKLKVVPAHARFSHDRRPHAWPKLAQLSLHFGVNDIDGTVVEEKITHAAGAQAGQEMSVPELMRMIRQAGRVPVERDTLYNIVREFPPEGVAV